MKDEGDGSTFIIRVAEVAAWYERLKLIDEEVKKLLSEKKGIEERLGAIDTLRAYAASRGPAPPPEPSSMPSANGGESPQADPPLISQTEAIIRVLSSSPEPMTARDVERELAPVVGVCRPMSITTVRSALCKMADRGLIVRHGRGLYSANGHTAHLRGPWSPARAKKFRLKQDGVEGEET